MPSEIVRLLRERKRVVLTTHTRPDGDAIGSELGLARYLDRTGHEVRVINADAAPHALDWLPGSRRVEIFDGSIDQRQAIDQADLIVVLDTNAEDRLGDLAPAVRGSRAPTLLIDHHTAPEDWFDFVWRDEGVSSTGQLVFDLVMEDDPDLLDRDLATALYVAIMTDTGSFRFSNVTPAVHRTIAVLLERGGLDPSPIHSELFDKRSLAGLRLLSRVLQTLTLAHDGQVAWMVVAGRALRDTGASSEDTEGFVNWGLSVEGVRIAIIFTETERGTKVSFRSKGPDHVDGWARNLGGGGHPNASGAFVRRGLEETIEAVVSQAPRYLGTAAESSDGISEDDREYLESLLNMKYRVKRI